jgi:NitT/TauT family transport system substrate-binding protein
MMDRKQALIAATSLGTLLFQPQLAGAQQLDQVTVGTPLDDGLTPVLYAQRTGIFHAHGLDVTLSSASSGAALAQAVAGGAIDIARSALMSLIVAYTRGVRFKLVAGASEFLIQDPAAQLCVLKKGPITSMAQAAGQIVAVNALQSLDQIGIAALVEKAGGTWQNVKFIEMPQPAMANALEDGRIAMASISNPSLQAALATGKLRTLGDAYAGIAPNLLIAGWFCTAQFAEHNEAVVQHFGEAVSEAAAFTNTHHDATVAMMADFAHLEPDVIQRMTRITSVTSLNSAMLQPAIDAAARYDMIPRAFSADELLLPQRRTR